MQFDNKNRRSTSIIFAKSFKKFRMGLLQANSNKNQNQKLTMPHTSTFQQSDQILNENYFQNVQSKFVTNTSDLFGPTTT